MSTFSDKIELYKIRSFGDLISDTFSFTRKNFKPLFSGLFYIVSPALLLSVVFGFLFWSKYFNFYLSMVGMAARRYEGLDEGYIINEFTGFFSYAILMGFFLYISFLLIIAATFSYIKLYSEDKERKITVTELWQSCRKYIWKILGAQLLVFFVYILALAVCFTPLLGGWSGIFFVFILLLALFFLSIFYIVKLSFFSLFIVVEDNGVMQSFSSSYQFTSGIFWKTLGLMIVLGFIVSIGMNILSVPGFVIGIINAILGLTTQTDHTFWTLFGSALASIGISVAYLLYVIVFIGQAMLYYSEMENRYGISSRREIEEIGKN